MRLARTEELRRLPSLTMRPSLPILRFWMPRLPCACLSCSLEGASTLLGPMVRPLGPSAAACWNWVLPCSIVQFGLGLTEDSNQEKDKIPNVQH